MEPVMKRIYLATAIAVVITTSIASHVLAIGALGPAMPGVLIDARSGARGVYNRLREFLGACVAAVRARRERRAAIVALSLLSDRELADIGLCRGSIWCDTRLVERERQALVDSASGFRASREPWR
jgi:uncharacterized protein YjiS (DUF1127 family)